MSYQPRRDFLSFSFCFFMGMIYFLLFNYNITILNIPFQTTHMTWHSKMPQRHYQESVPWAYMFTQEIKILRPRVIKRFKQERSDNQDRSGTRIQGSQIFLLCYAYIDEMAGWHHLCNGHELGQTSRDGEGQRGLACPSPWG